MSELKSRIQETVQFLNDKFPFDPEFGIVLGTGLGGLIEEIQIAFEISYEAIPHFAVSTVEGHSGKLIFGTIGGKKVVAMQGRFHFYEGYSMEEVTYPIRVLKFLGIETLILSNAAGGVNPNQENGDLMILSDHINFQPVNPLTGSNDETLGPRFPDMSDPYDQTLIDQAMKIAEENEIRCQPGVYLSLQGPNLETKAEYAMFNKWGADAVGMSTVPEVLVARHMGLKCFAMSVITNVCYPPRRVQETTHHDVIEVAAVAEPKLTKIIKELITKA